MEWVYLSIGSNMGDKLEMLKWACSEIEKKIGPLQKKSSVYETEPWGFETDERFFNQVVILATTMKAERVLVAAQAIEKKMGRETKHTGKRYSSRPIDIDIVYFGNYIVKTENLQIPHPRMTERLFVLVPLNEIASDLIHPEINKTTSELIEICNDTNFVKMID